MKKIFIYLFLFAFSFITQASEYVIKYNLTIKKYNEKTHEYDFVANTQEITELYFTQLHHDLSCTFIRKNLKIVYDFKPYQTIQDKDMIVTQGYVGENATTLIINKKKNEMIMAFDNNYLLKVRFTNDNYQQVLKTLRG